MSFIPKRMILTIGTWVQICEPDDINVTVENFGVDPYQTVYIIAGSSPPDDLTVTDYRTLRAGSSQNFTNLDEGTVLWARSVSQDTPIEVVAGG